MKIWLLILVVLPFNKVANNIIMGEYKSEEECMTVKQYPKTLNINVNGKATFYCIEAFK